jgi:DegV family protein with EDD domain
LKFKIVTDSTADLPPQLAKEMNITVVPVYVRFGDKIYRDRVDISEDEFYQRLIHDPTHPSTTQPSPQDFVDVYQNLASESDGIISIHVSSKLSGTYNSALRAKELVEREYPIEVVDSQLVTMGLGQLAIIAHRIAESGKNLHRVVERIKQMVPSIHVLGLLDTLKYLALGGRIGKVQALLGSVLSIKPILTIKDGELVPAGRVRNRSKGIDALFTFIKNAADIQDVAVVYNTSLDEAHTLIEHISSIFHRDRIRLARLGPALGVHTGPGILFLAFQGKV